MYITINPIGDRHLGDFITITAATNLPVDQDILVEIYRSSFQPTQKIPTPTPGPIFTKTVKVIPGDSAALQKITINVDTSSYAIGSTSPFTPDEYLVRVSTIDQSVTGNSQFNLLDGTGAATAPTLAPTQVATPPHTTPVTPVPPTPTPAITQPVTTSTTTTSATPVITPTPFEGGRVAAISPVATTATTSSVEKMLEEQNKKLNEQNKIIAEQNKKIAEQSGVLNQIISYFKGVFGWK